MRPLFIIVKAHERGAHCELNNMVHLRSGGTYRGKFLGLESAIKLHPCLVQPRHFVPEKRDNQQPSKGRAVFHLTEWMSKNKLLHKSRIESPLSSIRSAARERS